MVIFLAAVAAVSFASGSVSAKRGMQNTNVTTALIIASSVAALILGIVVSIDPPTGVTFKAVGLFALAGLAGDGIGRFTMLAAVDRLGPSTAIPIQTAAYPFIAVVGGVVLLSESVALVQGFGAVAIVGGIWVLLFRPPTGRGADDASESTARATNWMSLGLPVMAGIGFAVSDLFRKAGLDQTPEPAFGALIAVATMLVVLMAGAASMPRMRRQIRVGAGWGWLIASGGFITCALLALFEALDRGAVSTVGPIIAAQPLAIVVLSRVLLRDIERVTPRMVVGAILVVSGVIFIAISS